MSAGLGKSVCIVGAGILGLVATKNLLEEGLCSHIGSLDLI